jgi:fibulin 1/2
MCLNTFGNAFCSCPKSFTLSTEDYKTCISDEEPSIFFETTPPSTIIPPTQQAPENLEILNTESADCPPGSSLDSENSLICVEHDDCSVENGGCEHICIDSNNYRVCSCRKGYELVNETACMDVNECESENGGCDQECSNIPGTFFCSCKPGYTLKDDKRICERK